MNSTLPHHDKDAILTLYAHYFLASELMFKHYKKLLAKKSQHSRLGRKDRVHMSIYVCTWLGFLAVTAQGFKKLTIRKLIQSARPVAFVELIPMANELGKLLKKNDDALRKFRNNVFHLRENTEEIERFFRERHNRLEWAEELQAAFQQFFSDYRVLCDVHYATDSRIET